jgi:hypothetical protein
MTPVCARISTTWIRFFACTATRPSAQRPRRECRRVSPRRRRSWKRIAISWISACASRNDCRADPPHDFSSSSRCGTKTEYTSAAYLTRKGGAGVASWSLHLDVSEHCNATWFSWGLESERLRIQQTAESFVKAAHLTCCQSADRAGARGFIAELLTAAYQIALAFGRFARVAGALGMCGCVLLAAGCGRTPTAPAMSPGVAGPPQPSASTHIRGVVVDTVRRPLAGALVTVLDGPLAGTTKQTDHEGRFEVTGSAAGAVTLRATSAGFHEKSEALQWQPVTSTAAIEVQFWLETLEPPIGLEPGDYTLTVAIDLATADGHKNIPQAPCAGFPVELASRRYRVTIFQGSSSLYDRGVRAEDRPLHYENLFGFSIAGRFVGFEMDYGIPEDFPGFRFLNIIGIAPTSEPSTATGSSVSIPFYGEFRYCELKSARGIYNDCSQLPVEQIVDYHSCTSDHATMVFTRR